MGCTVEGLDEILCKGPYNYGLNVGVSDKNSSKAEPRYTFTQTIPSHTQLSVYYYISL